jgi:hypothetical protein
MLVTMSKLARLSGIAVLVVACLPAVPGVKVTFRDGKILEGREVKQKDGLYFLELETGNVLPIPTELVIQVELMVDEESIPTGLTKAEPETLAGPPRGIDLPTLTDQLRVMRDSTSRFRPNIIDPYWQPTSDWSNTPEINNNFNPARWYQPPIDPNWKPVNSLGKDVSNFNPARWYRAPIDSTWWPTDGFARRDR